MSQERKDLETFFQKSYTIILSDLCKATEESLDEIWFHIVTKKHGKNKAFIIRQNSRHLINFFYVKIAICFELTIVCFLNNLDQIENRLLDSLLMGILPVRFSGVCK